MKLTAVVILALMPFAAYAQKNVPAKETKGPQISFEETEHNFGIFSVDDAVQSCNFVFTNTGDEPLVIKEAVASCGCTVPTYPKHQIAPGAKDSINVVYDGSGKRPGVFKKVVTLTFNSKEYEIARVYIMGEMTDNETTERVLSGLEEAK